MKTSGELRNDFYKWLDDNPDGRVWDWMHKILKGEKSNQVEAQVGMPEPNRHCENCKHCKEMRDGSFDCEHPNMEGCIDLIGMSVASYPQNNHKLFGCNQFEQK